MAGRRRETGDFLSSATIEAGTTGTNRVHLRLAAGAMPLNQIFDRQLPVHDANIDLYVDDETAALLCRYHPDSYKRVIPLGAKA